MRINKMRRLTAFALAFGMTSPVCRLWRHLPAGRAQTASLSRHGHQFRRPDRCQRHRAAPPNLATGQLARHDHELRTGTFSFAGLQAGNYAVEVVNAAGQIIGTSAWSRWPRVRPSRAWR